MAAKQVQSGLASSIQGPTGDGVSAISPLASTSPPSRSPGRFIRHGDYGEHSDNSYEDDGDIGLPAQRSLHRHPLLMTSPTLFHDKSNEIHDIDGMINHSASPKFTCTRSKSPKRSLSYPSSASAEETLNFVSKHNSYPPTDNDTLVSHASSKIPHPQRRGIGEPHSPVPATSVFSRGAPPLFLPKLDRYLESLPPPHFKQRKGTDMFPPMDLLESSGATIDDLETNSKPATWRDRKSILGSAVGIVLGLTGSSALATFYSLQGMMNTVQVFALILSTIIPLSDNNITDKWRQLFLGTIPNILAFNFASTVVQSLVFLLVFMAISFGLLYYFYRSTRHCDRYNRIEGLQQTEPQGKQWGIVVVTFLLTVIYLPLSIMAVHVLVWSSDLWIVENPYTNATSLPPRVSPLGPAAEYRDPLDFCWTTTMKRNEINFAPVVIIISALVFLSLTAWFPIALRRVIKRSVPTVDRFTELGRPRNRVDLDSEYHRLLARDTNPFAFLYSGYRREWGTYQSTYLFAKLSTLVIVAVIDSDNCLFRSVSRAIVPIVRQSLLLTLMIGFFAVQCLFAPFLDPVSNASEWTSRLNYVATSLVALLVALDLPGKDALNDYVVYIIYIVTYGLSFYFTIINLGFVNRIVKRLSHRIDFSIDIFSPRLDTTPLSVHTKRRIWQESVSALFLTSPECKIPFDQLMVFAQSRDAQFPPFLLDFRGSPSERHVENLKILREVGSMAYNNAVTLISGPDYKWYKSLEDDIRRYYVGPDSFWRPPGDHLKKTCANFFGNAWWIPFPPTLVIRYDYGPYAVIQEFSDLQEYIRQNSSRDISRRREIRMALRALEGQRVLWPYEHVTSVGSQSVWSCRRRRYNARSSFQFQTCVLEIKRRGHLQWENLALGSGFNVQLSYSKKVKKDADVIGLNDDFDLTAPLARFLILNQDLVYPKIQEVERTLSHYREHHLRQCSWKSDVLSYRFLSAVYDQPRDPNGLAGSCMDFERDVRVRRLLAGSEDVFESIYERFTTVAATEASTWWYIFWDDLWRRNHDTIKALKLHAFDFNPYYPSSIAYTPLPRPALEAFLIQRGLLSNTPKRNHFFHSGFLNKIYLRLNEAVFRHSNKAVLFHIDGQDSELDMESVDLETRAPFNLSSLGTGGGTDHDNSSIIARPAYRWEGLLNDPLGEDKRRRQRYLTKLGTWFGLTPLWRSEMPSHGLSVDVRLESGRYVLIDRGM